MASDLSAFPRARMNTSNQKDEIRESGRAGPRIRFWLRVIVAVPAGLIAGSLARVLYQIINFKEIESFWIASAAQAVEVLACLGVITWIMPRWKRQMVLACGTFILGIRIITAMTLPEFRPASLEVIAVVMIAGAIVGSVAGAPRA